MNFFFRIFGGRHEFVLHAIGTRPLKLLDVGNLGDGASTCVELRNVVEENGGTYVGLDSNEQLTRTLNLSSQVIGDIHHTNFPDSSFDAIYLGELIEHTWIPSTIMQECARILKPSGLLIIDTPNPYSLVHILRFLLLKRDSMGDNRTLTYHEAKNTFSELKEGGATLLQPQHKIFFTPAMLTQLLETHGFVVEEIGCTRKARTILHRILLWIFPQTGPHLCCVARKATLDEAFADVVGKNIEP